MDIKLHLPLRSSGVLIPRMAMTTRKYTVYPKKYAHGFCFAVLCCGYTLTDFPISIRLTSLALWQSNDCPSASKATLMNMDKYFMWIHYERLRNHNKAKHNKTVCIFLGIYCTWSMDMRLWVPLAETMPKWRIASLRYSPIIRHEVRSFLYPIMASNWLIVPISFRVTSSALI